MSILSNYLVPRFLDQASDITQRYISELKIRHCLCSEGSFSMKLLSNDKGKYDGIEWAECHILKTRKGDTFIFRIPNSGHIISCIYVPIYCIISVGVNTYSSSPQIYYFSGNKFDEGVKTSLFIPLVSCTDRFELYIETDTNITEIPLTVFYINIKQDFIKELEDNIKYIENVCKYNKYKDLGKKINFLLKGRFNEDSHIFTDCIVPGTVRKSSLGNYELVSLITQKSNELEFILREKYKNFQLLD